MSNKVSSKVSKQPSIDIDDYKFVAYVDYEDNNSYHVGYNAILTQIVAVKKTTSDEDLAKVLLSSNRYYYNCTFLPYQTTSNIMRLDNTTRKISNNIDNKKKYKTFDEYVLDRLISAEQFDNLLIHDKPEKTCIITTINARGVILDDKRDIWENIPNVFKDFFANQGDALDTIEDIDHLLTHDILVETLKDCASNVEYALKSEVGKSIDKNIIIEAIYYHVVLQEHCGIKKYMMPYINEIIDMAFDNGRSTSIQRHLSKHLRPKDHKRLDGLYKQELEDVLAKEHVLRQSMVDKEKIQSKKDTVNFEKMSHSTDKLDTDNDGCNIS